MLPDTVFAHNARPQDANISCDDFTRMQVMERGHVARSIPDWVRSEARVQKVIVARAWALLHARSIPPLDVNWKYLDQQVMAHLLHKVKTKPCKFHIERYNAAARLGSYMTLQGSIIWRTWRLGHTAREIANDLGVTPAAIHSTLASIRCTAQRLGLEPRSKSRAVRDGKWSAEAKARHSEIIHTMWRKRRAE
jgi:DNA-binding CsgD family transcriptional regulator